MAAAGDRAALPFVKMEGAGNDYVYIDLEAARGAGWSPSDLEDRAAELAPRLADRHRGVGADGLVLIDPRAPRMAMWNADGSAAELCGNALRCVALWLHLRGLRPTGEEFAVGTASGQMRCTVLESDGVSGRVRVELPPPRFAAGDVPFRPEVAGASGGRGRPWVMTAEVAGRTTACRILSVGNPHLVAFLDAPSAVAGLDLESAARALVRPEVFPNGANVSIAAPSGGGLVQRTFERGSGETLACGSGACAAVVAAADAGLAAWDRDVPVRFRGGTLTVRAGRGGGLRMTGPARLVFEGRFACASGGPE